MRELSCAFTPKKSLEAIRDTAASQIVGRKLHLDLVARQDPDEVHPHLARDVREDFQAVLQLHAKHRVGQGLDDGPANLDGFFFGQTSYPVFLAPLPMVRRGRRMAQNDDLKESRERNQALF